jgi:hypothetical protein
MPFEENVYSVTKQAGEDLSAKQYYFVTLNASGQVVLPTATTDVPYGILQNAPGSLQAAQVMRVGVSRLVLGGSIATGSNNVGTDTVGKGTLYAAGTAGTAAYPVGYMEVGADAADRIGAVAINCINPHRAF